ncbi:MAG: helix-turn-helix domain-containing protein [Thermoguttaceae bacterium]
MPPRVATGSDVQCLTTARLRDRVRQKSTDGQSPLPRCGPNNLTVELGQASSDRLERLEAILDGIAAILLRVQEQQDATTATLTELRDFVVTQRTVKDWYSTVEVAEILGKKPYTVREWCRLQRVKARKRPTGRGDADEWEISHDELERIKNHGLLPIPTKY